MLSVFVYILGAYMKQLKVLLGINNRKRIALLILFISPIFLGSKRAEPYTLSDKSRLSEDFPGQNENVEISQSQRPEYICDTGAEITNAAPPNVNWRSSITCLRGTPSRIEMFIYYANVNFPKDYIYVGKNTFNCSGSSYCTTPTYSRPLDRTQMFHVVARVYVKGAETGVIFQDFRQPSVIRAFNDKGVMYPEIKPTRTDMPRVPYYGPPYSVIATRNNTFASDLRTYYNSQGWTIPPSPEAHHIKPLSWGGDNNQRLNGVFLGPATHRLFTNWWLQFNNRYWAS